jgi:hypothetical protein
VNGWPVGIVVDVVVVQQWKEKLGVRYAMIGRKRVIS